MPTLAGNMVNTALVLATEVDASVRIALDEDVGPGDLTASFVADENINAELICREPAVICGRPWFDASFHLLDESISIEWMVNEGDLVQSNEVVCRVQGPANMILTAERTAINFLQTLSAVSTTTKHYVDAVVDTDCKILDTRKTIPGLRKAEKYAVSCGGGNNHRIGLYDAILIKENHIHAAGSVCTALQLAKVSVDPEILIEVEVETIDQLKQAIDCGASRVLLDNFAIDVLYKAVELAGDTIETEASGNINLENIGKVALSGVNFISIGALTKNIVAIDFSLLFKN